jgi:hypothetical protein
MPSADVMCACMGKESDRRRSRRGCAGIRATPSPQRAGVGCGAEAVVPGRMRS